MAWVLVWVVFCYGSRQNGVIVVFGGLCIDYISGMVTSFQGIIRKLVTLYPNLGHKDEVLLFFEMRHRPE